jgi:hypothetical protein
MKDVTVKLEEVLAEGLEKLGNLDPGSKEYGELVDQLQKLYKQMNDDRKLEFDIFKEKDDRELREAQLKQDKKKDIFTLVGAILGFGGTVAAIMANTAWIKGILHFEKTGTITAKAFNFVGRINPFRH